MGAESRRPAWFLLTRHWLSLVGVGLVTTAGFSWLFVLPMQIRGHHDNPYVGIVVFMVLPAVFFVGLALIPIGIYVSRRAIRQGLAEVEFDRRAAIGRLAWFFGITTLVNLIIGTQVTYGAVKHMETPQFCGGACHSMSLELAAYQHSPHARVECVECHVAPGAGGWISSKSAGVRQLIETVFNTYPRPIPSALESNRLVPAQETCENCHWPQKFSGLILRVLPKYAEDETNTRTQTVLLMLVGGTKIAGIHGAHFGPGVQIRFAAPDGPRQNIPWVEYRNTIAGEARIFSAPDSKPESVSSLPHYDMQCVDCHNRPTHTFDLPERAMDKALALGDIAVTLPYIKKKGVEVLKASYSRSEQAAQQLPQAVTDFYKASYPELYAQRRQDIDHAAREILDVYSRNVSPDLRVTWGTYPDNLGHTDFPGCFRCHDGVHESPDGKVIGQDCGACHQTLAMEETSPAILETLGVAERISNVQKK